MISSDGENNGTAIKRLAEQGSHEPCRLVVAEGCNRCRPVCRYTLASSDLDRCPSLDGDCVRSKCKTLRTNPLPVYRALLLGDDIASARSGLRPSLREYLRMARTCPSDSLWRLGYSVDDRAAMGQVLQRLMSAIGTKRTSLVAPHMSAFGGRADMTFCAAHVCF
jgi:hypothetical protein